MNLAQVYSPLYEYHPCAMVRFAWPEQPRPPQITVDLAAVNEGDRPVLRVPLQKAIWEVFEDADAPLTRAELERLMGLELTQKERNSVGVFISGWHSDGWLDRAGSAPRFAYWIKGRTQ